MLSVKNEIKEYFQKKETVFNTFCYYKRRSNHEDKSKDTAFGF